MKKFAILILAASVQVPVYAGIASLTPAPGPHAVGLRVLQQYDYSRAMDEQVDAFGKPVATPPARPASTRCWSTRRVSPPRRTRTWTYASTWPARAMW